MKIHLPTAKEIRDLFVDLIDRPVTLEPSAPLAPGRRQPASAAVYVDDYLRTAALICFDLPLSAHLGAAIGLVPAASAAESIEAGTLSEVLRENLHEVFNISTNLFARPGADHLRLHAVHAAGEPLPPEVLVGALTLGRRTDMRVDVPGYGTGVLSVVLTF